MTKLKKESISYMTEERPIFQINKDLLEVHLKNTTTQQKRKFNKGH